MSLSLREYLSRKGTVELLCEIHPRGSRFGELFEEIPVSRPTLSKRLIEGRDLSLLGREAVTGKKGTTHTHVLTPKGATVRNLMHERGLVMDYKQYKSAREQFEQNKQNLIEFMADDLPHLENERINEDNLHALIQRSELSDFVEE